MKLKLTAILFTCMIINSSFAQKNTWRNVLEGKGPGNENISTFAVDDKENTVAVVRYTGDSVSVGGTTITEKSLRWKTGTLTQLAIIKMNKELEIKWFKSLNIIDSAISVTSSDLFLDADGNSILFLNLKGSPNFRLVLDDDTLLPYQGFFRKEISTLIKLDPNGKILWHLEIEMARSFLTMINIDKSGNIYLGGSFSNGTREIIFNSLKLSNPHYTTGGEVFIVKLNSEGKAIWGNTFGGKYHESINDMDIDRDGNVYFCGIFSSDSILFANDTLIHPSGGAPVFPNYCYVAKLNEDGSPEWARSNNSRYSHKGALRRIFSESSQLYSVVGISEEHNFKFEKFTLNKGAFLANYNSSGTLQSAFSFSDTMILNYKDLQADSSGNLFLAGYFNRDSLKINNVWEKNFGIGSGTKDIYAIKFDSSDKASLYFHIGGEDDDDIDAFIVSPSGNIKVAGNFKSNRFHLDTIEIENSQFPSIDFFLADFGLMKQVQNDVKRVKSSNLLKVYPNPAKDILFIEHELPIQSYRMSVYNLTGELIKSEKHTGRSSSIDISDLKNGVYVFTIYDEGILHRSLIIKK